MACAVAGNSIADGGLRARIALSTIGALFGGGLTAAFAGAVFENPVLDSGADPWVTHYRGYYYYVETMGDRIQIWKTRDMTKLRSGVTKVIWRALPSGPNSGSIWAPELHLIGTKWYLYYTGSDRTHDDDLHRHSFVMENSTADPLSDKWVSRGMLLTTQPGIDGTVFWDHGHQYFVYSAYVGPDSDLIIAPMSNPWTISAPQVDVARPTYAWEKQGGRQILEGPEFLKGRRGQRILLYSASACWSDDYSIGMLVAAPGANLLDAASWKKTPEPVFKSAPQNGVYAPGHNGFFKSPDGREDWIIFHANSGPGQGCGRARSPRIQKFTWRADGLPNFGIPAATGIPLAVPSTR